MNYRVKWLAAAAVTVLAAGPAAAGHSWNTYHWAFDGVSVKVDVGDNVTSKWDTYLTQSMEGGPRQDPSKPAGEGWNDTDQIKGRIVPGSTNPKNCKAVSNTIQVCSERYGRTGWLGVAQIWLSGGHIVQGITKVNDTYFDTAKYNTPGWRMMVMCQEIGHDYGLGHVNETFDDPNTGSCMDYTNDPVRDNGKGTNEYINAHDKEQLGIQYGHADSASTNFGVRDVGKAVPQASFPDKGIGGNTPAAWGRVIGRDGQGRADVYELDFGNGRKRITHVFWAIGEGPKGGHHAD